MVRSRMNREREVVVSRSYAKVNLALAVDAPLKDGAFRGYHPIASWFHCLDLWDDITVRQASVSSGCGETCDFHVAWADDAPRTSPIDWPPEKDLCVRAHGVMEELAARAMPVRIEVRKRVPVGAGLGGGSSNAASVMLALNELFDLGIPRRTMRRASAKLGSDIAFFIDDDTECSEPSRPAIVTGLGDVIERVRPVSAGERLLLIFPPFGCPTGPVYRAFDAICAEKAPWMFRESDVRALVDRAARGETLGRLPLFNDLARPACVVEPQLATALEALRGAGWNVHVTGSGSTMFVPCGKGEAPNIDCARLVAGASVREVQLV
jgi:4-diphosphocytidyl-2-C-methyl-D-erythritol kinase